MTPFASIFVPEEYRASVSDEAWVAAMLEFEAALANACAEVGLIPAEHAEQIAESCRPESFPAVELAQEGHAAGNPAAPLVKRLRAAVGEPAASSVHLGSTSQDVVDTAAMLVAARTIDLILEDLGAVADETAALARAHRSTPIAGRTLLQQAVPTTFGAKCAVWLVAVLEARSELARIRAERLAVQLGGAAGTLGPLGQDGARVLALVAGRLGLAEPVVPWHTDRTRIAQIGAALTLVAGVMGKIGLDVALLAQTEVGEVAEGDGGGSSAMPQKQNPVGATVTRACVQLVRGHALVLSEALGQEHERATGAWHAEWAALAGALAFTGGAVSSARRTLSGLVVDAERMRANLNLTGGAITAERVAVALAGSLGRDRADEVIGEAAKRSTASGRALRDGASRRPGDRASRRGARATARPGNVPRLGGGVRRPRARGLRRRRVSDVHDEGMKTRREVLGDEHVDRAIAGTTPFTAAFQDLITRYAWGEIWSRPGLDRRTRSCITLMALIALGHERELEMHVRAALRIGLTPQEVEEVILQSAIYCGVPAANSAFTIAQRVVEEESG